MGCDIHIWVEVQDENGKWHMVPKPEAMFHDEYSDEVPEELRGKLNSAVYGEYMHGVRKLPIPLPYNIEDFMGKDEDGRGEEGCFSYSKWWRSSHPLSSAGSRNYSAFAILADVRNGRGFAGIQTGEGFIPISNPRGVPDDASDEYKGEVDRWNGDGHSHSYHTLQQLLDYDWEQKTTHYGVVGMLEFAKWIKSGRAERGQGPVSYSGGVSGPNVRMVEEKVMLDFVMQSGLLDALGDVSDDDGGFHDSFINAEQMKERFDVEVPDGKSWHTRVKWVESYQDSVFSFHTKFIPWLQSLGLPPDKVRIVFFFDN